MTVLQPFWNRLIEAKVHGIIVGGSTGEYYAQTAQERFDLAAYAKDVIGTRLPLIVGTGATRTEDSIEYARAAKDIGADAILVSSPPYALPTGAKMPSTPLPSTAPPTCRSCSTTTPPAWV